MRRKTSAALSVLTVLALLVGVFPVTAAAVLMEPTFSGTITKTVTLPDAVTFTDEDFTGLYDKNDGADLASVRITGTNPAFGALKLDGAAYALGTFIPLADLEDGKLSFAATDDGTVSYSVYARAEGDATQYGPVTLTITVEEDDYAGTVDYTTDKNTPVDLVGAHFADAFKDATNNALSYVNFRLPLPTRGTLYIDYVSPSHPGDPVEDDVDYSVSDLSDITFVPAEDFTGRVNIAYTAYNAGDDGFAGLLKITVSVPEATAPEGSAHFNDVGRRHAWAVEAIDCLYDEGIIQGVGHGYYNPVASISRGDFITMLCRAFDLSAEDFTGGGKSNPKSALSRQDAMVLLVEALDAADKTLPASGTLTLDDFSDSGKISPYAVDAVETLVEAGIIQGYDGKLNPKAGVSRAEMAVILYRVLDALNLI